MLARSEDGVAAVQPLERRAAGARLALVAGRDPVAQICAPRTLAEVAAHRGHVPQLLGGAEEQGLGDRRIPLGHPGGPRHVAHARQCPDVQTAVGQIVDGREREVVDVDEMVGAGDAGADEIDLVRAAREEGAGRVLARQRDRILHTGGAAVAERPHAPPPSWSRTCRIAARMFGYAAQRQMLPLMNSAMSSSVEALPSSISLTADMICPEVQ
jgi:hypothetical protein